MGESPASGGDCGRHALVAEKGDGGVAVEPLELRAGEACLVESARVPRALGEHEAHAVGAAAVGCEDECLEAGGVKPLGVVDHDQDRRRIGAQRQQRQGGAVDRQRGGARGRESQRPAQRLGLHRGEFVEAVEQRPQHRGQTAEGETPLELDTRGPQHLEATAPGLGGRPVEQGRLALAHLTLDDDHRGAVAVHAIEQAGKHVQLGLPAPEAGGELTSRARRCMPRHAPLPHGSSLGAVTARPVIEPALLPGRPRMAFDRSWSRARRRPAPRPPGEARPGSL